MASILFKWFLVAALGLFKPVPHEKMHPFYVSIVEIEHNAHAKTLEVSCKIFTDDFEQTLRAANKNVLIDLINPSNKNAMDKLVNEYVQKNLKLKVDGQPVTMKYVGYERIEEGIYSYFEAEKVSAVNSITIMDKVLYDYKKEQTGLIHVRVNGKRKSTRLANPDDTVTLAF
jgi:hypothetical protein